MFTRRNAVVEDVTKPYGGGNMPDVVAHDISVTFEGG